MKKAIDYFITLVESVDQLPEPVAQVVRQHLPDETIQRIMVVPPQEQLISTGSWVRILWHGWQKIPQRTLVFCENHIAIIEADRSGGQNTTVIPVNALTRITLGKVLLVAYVEFAWVSEGAFKTIRVEFHATNDDLVNEQLNQVRSVIAAYPSDTDQTRFGDEGRVDIQALPFKFRNYLTNSLLPAEHVLAAVFQPVMRQLERRLYRRTIAPNRTVALTDQHVILVEEEMDRSTSRYSVITHYYPLHCVRQVKFATTPEAVWMHLAVGIPGITQEVDIPLWFDEAARLNRTFSRIPAVSVVNLATA